MKVLFFTYDIPWPLTSGGKVRAFNLIKELSQVHTISLFSFYRNEKQKNDVEELKKYCQSYTLVKRRSIGNPLNFLFSGMSTLPFAMALYHPILQNHIFTDILSGTFDLLHFDSLYPAVLMDKRYNVPQVLSTLNAEHLIYQGYVDKQILPLRMLFSLDTLKLRRYEEGRWRRADVVTAVSDEDAEIIEKATGNKVPIVPNGVDTAWFGERKDKREKGEKRILFVGDFTYFPNRDAVNFLLKELWQKIELTTRNSQLTTKLLIAGRNIPADIKNKAGENIIIKENVQDIRDVYNKADVLLVPLRMGSGTKFKVLEAMASGVPVVATSIGAAGLEAADGKEIMIADTAGELAQRTVEVLENPELAKKLSANALKLVQKKYSWKEIAKKLNAVWIQAVRNY